MKFCVEHYQGTLMGSRRRLTLGKQSTLNRFGNTVTTSVAKPPTARKPVEPADESQKSSQPKATLWCRCTVTSQLRLEMAC
jgi:hypothetical protein